jgi:hypothetical protein
MYDSEAVNLTECEQHENYTRQRMAARMRPPREGTLPERRTGGGSAQPAERFAKERDYARLT